VAAIINIVKPLNIFLLMISSDYGDLLATLLR
jgi:hypothetical protein